MNPWVRGFGRNLELLARLLLKMKILKWKFRSGVVDWLSGWLFSCSGSFQCKGRGWNDLRIFATFYLIIFKVVSNLPAN